MPSAVSGMVNRCPQPDTILGGCLLSPRHLRAVRCGVGGYE